jgi:hypothetical protein
VSVTGTWTRGDYTPGGMEGEFSWLVLVAAFVIVAGCCGILAARLCGIIGSAGGPGMPSGDTQADAAGRSSP